MRLGAVIGRVTLSVAHPSLTGGRFLVCRAVNARQPLDARGPFAEVVVVYDDLNASPGDLIAISESREATMPFYPQRMVPIDAYNAAILDRVTLNIEHK